VLGRTLHHIFINDIADKFCGLEVTLKLFADEMGDDVKLYLCYNTTANNDDLRKSITRLIDW